MQTKRIVVSLGDAGAYDVRVGSGILEKLGVHLRKLEGFHEGTGLLLLSDEKTASLYGARVKKILQEAGFRVRSISVPAGEAAKQVSVVAELWEALAQLGFDRSCAVVTLGGGAVGDAGGFAASTFMRGMPVVQVPTTLLAMADSSIGGKTAINLKAGKNLVGTFWQPSYVCADTAVLSTLDEREWACGCAEIAKTALLAPDDSFFWLLENAPALAARDEEVTAEALQRSLVFKADIVAQDVYDRLGIRECLNFGHTFGHALEAAAGFGTHSHGQCVAEGMRFAMRLGAEVQGTPLEAIAEVDDVLDVLGLPPVPCSKEDFDAQGLLARMKRDKKTREGDLRFVLLDENLHWHSVSVPEETVLAHAQAWLSARCF